MTTAVLLPGTPYRAGDFVEVENGRDQWQEVLVTDIDHPIERAAFGHTWQLTFMADGQVQHRLTDGEGFNHTIGRRVRPSGRVRD